MKDFLRLLLAASIVTGCAAEPTAPKAFTAEPATSSGTWTTRASMPTIRQSLAAAVVQNSSGQYVLYAIGGRNPTNPAMKRVEAYNASANTWTRKADLPAKRAATNGTGVISGKIYLVGGFDLNGVTTKTLYVYTPATNTWAKKADLPVSSAQGITGVIDGKLYVVTGYSVSCSTCNRSGLRRLYRYNPTTNTWTRLADPPRFHVEGVGGVIDGKLYVDWGLSITTDVYNPATNQWSAKVTQEYFGTASTCVEGLQFCSVFGAAGATLDKKLYVIGGLNDDESMPITEAYDPIANKWVNKTFMHFSRENPAAGKVKNGAGQLQILVVGGFSNDPGEYVSVSEAFTP